MQIRLVYDTMKTADVLIFPEVTKLRSHKRKMIAPIIITVLVVLYLAVYFGFLAAMLTGLWKYILGIVPAALAAVMIGVCIERIREIRKGEEDDLGQY